MANLIKAIQKSRRAHLGAKVRDEDRFKGPRSDRVLAQREEWAPGALATDYGLDVTEAEAWLTRAGFTKNDKDPLWSRQLDAVPTEAAEPTYTPLSKAVLSVDKAKGYNWCGATAVIRRREP